MRKKLLGLLSIIFVAVLLVACGDSTYKVSFDLNGGTSAAIAAKEVKEGGLVEKPTDPTRDGYTFVHWADADNEEWDFANDKVTKNITLKAQWEVVPAVKYTVTFDADGGTPVPANQEVTKDAKATLPTAPTKAGFTFIGWFLGEEEFDFDTAITANITLKAKWEAIPLAKYTVTFDADGGTPVPANQEVEEGAKATEPTAPTKTDYIFLGWFLDGEEYDFDTPVTEGLELVARWEADYDVILAAIEAHYAETLANSEWSPTEDVELITEMQGVAITWSSSNVEFFSNTGEVKIPTYSEGDQTIMLTAQLTPLKSKMFFFSIKALEQTTEELLDEILRIVTIVPASTTGYQEDNFEVTGTWKIGEEDVLITWVSSDETVMKSNGELVSFEDAAEKEVTLTATIEYSGVTRVKEILFLVKGVTSYASFKDALVDANENERVKVEGVTFFSSIHSTNTSSGYYVASEDNMIAYVYGAIPAGLKEGKLYDVLFNVQLYFGSFQLNAPAFVNERDGTLPTITPVEMTLDDVVNLPKPLTESFNHTYLKLVNVEVRINLDIADDRYNTFLVPAGLPTDTVLNDMNSIMVYYVSDLDVIKGLNGRRIDEILLINNGYRTNNIVWYVNYVGDGSDIVMGPLTDEETVVEVANQLKGLIPYRSVAAGTINLPVERESAAIVWTSSHPEIIAADGTVVLPTAGTVVTLTASITRGEAEATFTREVWVGDASLLEADTAAEVIAYDDVYALMPFKVVGVVTGAIGNRSYSFEDATGAIGLYAQSSQVLEIGFEYTIVGIKRSNQGINQLSDFTALKGEAKPLPDAVVLTEANIKDNVYMGELRAKLVSFENAEITSITIDGYGTTEVMLKVGTASIMLRWDNRVTLPEGALDHLRSLEVGDKVDIVKAPVGWYNNPQLGYNDASQVVVAELESDADKVAAAIAALEVPTTATEDIVLPTTGRFDTNIVWASSHPEIIAVDGKITLPEENTVVTLTATVSIGEATDTAEFIVYVQADENLVSIAIAFASAADTEVEFIGVVTGFTDYSTEFSNYDKVWLEDATGTITVYRGAFAPDLAVGDKYKISGKMGAFRGLIQVAQGSTQTLIDRDNSLIAPTNVTDITVLKPVDQASRINVTGIVKSINGTGRQMVVTVGETDVTVRSISDTSPVNTHILTGSAGQKVNLKGIHVDWYDGVQLLPTMDAQIEFTDLTDAEKLQLVVTELEGLYADKVFNMGAEITLLATSNGVAIAWVTDPASAIADGKWADVTEDTEVTLTATLTIGEEETTISLDVTVKFVDTDYEGETYTETFDGFAAELATVGTSYGDFSYTGVNGVVWTIVHATDEDGGSNGVYAINGTTVVLRRSDEPSSISAKFINGFTAFSFDYRKAFTGATARKYKVDITNNGTTTTYDLPEFGSGSGADETVHKYTYSGPALVGEVTVKVYATGATGNQQAGFDNFTWTE